MRKGKLNVPHPHTCSRARFAQLARLGGAKRCFANSRLNPRGGVIDLLAALDSHNAHRFCFFTLNLQFQFGPVDREGLEARPFVISSAP